MKVYTNSKLIQTRQKLAMRASLAGMAILFLALLMSFQFSTALHPMLPLLAWPLALVGLLVATLGTYIINRWVRPPLAHDALAIALKGLDNKHLLFNYVGPVPHLLVSPRGLFAIVAKRYDGKGAYENGRWRGSFDLRRMYTQGMTAEGLGNPDLDLKVAEQEAEEWLQKALPDYAEQIPVGAMAVFINPKAQIEMGETTQPIAMIDNVKKLLKRDFFPGVKEIPFDAYKALVTTLETQAGPKV